MEKAHPQAPEGRMGDPTRRTRGRRLAMDIGNLALILGFGVLSEAITGHDGFHFIAVAALWIAIRARTAA